jgi:DAK2 domain fusion protein YloV
MRWKGASWLSKLFIDVDLFRSMLIAAANRLQANVQHVNALNVFPVPDGDTGTNMNLTFSSGLDELRKNKSIHLGQAAELVSRGLLMGARGNSGVILSQLFRGFAKHISTYERVDAVQFADALKQGVEAAYAAVIRPVEGTILTVSKMAATKAQHCAKLGLDPESMIRELLQAAREALSQTPDLLPILKQVGVVDSGGQGLVYIYEGFYEAVSGQFIGPSPSMQQLPLSPVVAHMPVQSHFTTDSIEHGYCTEFILLLSNAILTSTNPFQEKSFSEKLQSMGDSLVVIADDDLVKVHIHAEQPGDVMNYAMQFGALTRIKIENMREQHSHILSEDAVLPPTQTRPAKLIGIVAVAAGEVLAEIFMSLGVDHITSGGQTMNPSTEQIIQAIENVNAEHIFILPNNSNIVLAAGQARDLSRKAVTVIPTKSIQQGMAAALAFQEHSGLEHNIQIMTEAIAQVKSGYVTTAIRDSELNGVLMKEGDFIGMVDGEMMTSHHDLSKTCEQLLIQMLETGDEVVSIFIGQLAPEAATQHLQRFMDETFPNVEVEFVNGSQPVYHYLFSVDK